MVYAYVYKVSCLFRKHLLICGFVTIDGTEKLCQPKRRALVVGHSISSTFFCTSALCLLQMSQKFRHSFGYLSISDFLKQIPPRNTLIILFFFYTHQSLSMKTKRFGAGCSSPGSWLKINGSVLRDQKVWKKTKELNMCRIYICFEKSLIDKFLRTLKKK